MQHQLIAFYTTILKDESCLNIQMNRIAKAIYIHSSMPSI